MHDKDFAPLLYEDANGKLLWQPRLPDGTYLFYRPDGEIVSVTIDEGDRKKYRPLVANTIRHALKTGRIAWRDKKKWMRDK